METNNSLAIIKQLKTPTKELHTPAKKLQTPARDLQSPFDGLDAMQIAFLQLYESVQTGRQTAQIQAKSSEANINQQNILIGQNAQINFQNLSWKELFTHKTVKKNGKKVQETVEKTDAGAKLEQLASVNDEIEAMRSVMEQKINVLGQANSVENANLSNTLNISEESVSAASKTEQELGSLTTQIARAES